jgi:ATPase subunit of ABC transporter with duplicated ATPase domains
MVLPPDDMPISKMSGGERRRVALSVALLENPICCCSMNRQT